MKRGCRLAGPSSDREVETQNGVRLDGCTSWLAWLHLSPPRGSCAGMAHKWDKEM